MRRQDPGVIVKVAGLDTPEKARALVGCEIWVPRAAAAPLDDDEYYAADLCRCSLWFGEEELGAVRSVWEGGPAQLLEVVGKGEDLARPLLGALHRGRGPGSGEDQL